MLTAEVNTLFLVFLLSLEKLQILPMLLLIIARIGTFYYFLFQSLIVDLFKRSPYSSITLCSTGSSIHYNSNPDFSFLIDFFFLLQHICASAVGCKSYLKKTKHQANFCTGEQRISMRLEAFITVPSKISLTLYTLSHTIIQEQRWKQRTEK